MRIVHISDFHLRHCLDGTSAVPARLSRKMVDCIPIAMRRIVDAGADLIVVSGDLVDHPFEDVDSADHLERGRIDLQWYVDTLSIRDVPVVVLPGNHDHLRLFHEVFHLPVDLDVGGVRVVSFADAEGEGHIPQRVGDEHARFEQVLTDDDRRPQIHLQHYLVYPRRDEGYPHTYGNGGEMRQAITNSGRVRMCLSGHYHPGHDPECVQGTWFAVAPAFCESPHPWRIYDLDVDSGDLNWHARELG